MTSNYKNHLAVFVASVVMLFLTVPVSANIFGDQPPPHVSAQEEFQGATEGVETLRDRISKSTSELNEMTKISPEEARKTLERHVDEVDDLLDRVQPGGDVHDAVQGAIAWMKNRHAEVSANQNFTEADRAELLRDWNDQIARMTGNMSALNDMANRLASERANFYGALDFLAEKELIATAEAMNQAVQRILVAMDEALKNLQVAIPVS